jgi:uncharacterized membrane protein YraQ (UPF0718 family)
MNISLNRKSSLFIVSALFIVVIMFVNLQQGIQITADQIQNIKTIFISIILEALPFVILGVFISSVIQIFVSETTIQRFTPKNPLLGILFACLLGICFPLCECGMIPVVRRLIHKGMPVFIAVVFIVVGPVLNPVVYASTHLAFQVYPAMAYARMGLSFLVAMVLGLVLYRFVKSSPLLTANFQSADQQITQMHEHEHGHTHLHNHNHDHNHGHSQSNKLMAMLKHAADEFFEMGKYLIIGSLLTAIIQTFISRGSLVTIGHHTVLSNLFMMVFAFILSLCSTSDAFVAASFSTMFTKTSLLTFLVFGPMIDLKVTLMLLSIFKKRFVLILILLVALLVFIGSMLIHYIGFLA